MIKLIIFDLDGVIVDARELHYKALNAALLELCGEKFIINRSEHLAKYDGLPTTKKLELLTTEKGLSKDLYNKIWALKQEKTFKIIKNTYIVDDTKKDIFEYLHNNNYKVVVCTNSIRKTTRLTLVYLGLIEYIDEYYTNEDVRYAKPNPEMYLRAMVKFGVSPKETLIIEDSHHGRNAVFNSGAHLLGVKNSYDVTLNKILNKLENINGVENKVAKWQGNNMNIVIPMAGAGKRFQEAGYTFPKPLIDIHSKPMIQVVVENLNVSGNYIFIVQKEHYEKYNLKYLLELIAPGCKIIQIDGITEGAACTVLMAKDLINNDDPLVIANSDQFMEWESNEFFYSVDAEECDGGIATFESIHPKWSYAKLDDNGFVCEVAEKRPISNRASCGLYYYKHGSDFVKAAEEMIQANDRVNNEFYVAPVFNYMIKNNLKIKVSNIEKMWGLGTPEDLQEFLNK